MVSKKGSMNFGNVNLDIENEWNSLSILKNPPFIMALLSQY